VADQRITQLTQLNEADVASTDVLPIVDISASETKKVTAKDLFEAGATLADGSSIDLAKLNQSSATKLGTTALADSSVTAAKLADDSSVVYGSVEPSTNNFEGRGYVNSTSKYLKIWDGSVYQQVIAPTAGIENLAITTGKIADNAVTTAKVDAAGLGTAAIANSAITAAKFQTGAVDAAAIATGAIGTDELAANAVTYAKIQQTSGTDVLLGRSTAGAGNVEEISCTSAGRALLDDADAAAQRTTLGLGTIATQGAGAVAITGGTISGITSLTSTTSSLGNVTITGGTITGITDLPVADGGTGASDAGTARTNLGLAIGTNVQAYDAGLQSISGLTTSADQTVYTTASDIYATTSLTSFGRSLIDDADAATARTTLGLGTLATQSGTFSGTHSGTTSGTNTGDQTITLTGDVTGSGTGSFATTIANDAISTAKIATGAVTTDELGAASVTAAKLAADSSTIVSGNAPTGSGAFEGQQWFNTNTGLAYVWDGSTWIQQAGVQSFVFTDSTPIAFSSSVSAAGVATITSSLDTQTAATVFAGPTTGSAAAPTFRALASGDLPVAATGTPGAISPGTGLSVAAGGVLNHTNVVSAGTYTKVTIDAQGHVSTGATLAAADIPSLDASKITTGTFSSAFLAANSVTAAQLADYGIAQVSESQPTPEFAGQWWINPSDRSAYIWVGTVSPSINGYWLLVGYGSPTQLNLRFGGTYNASTNLVVTLNQYGTEAGLTVGQALGAPSSLNNGVYLAVTTAGTGTTPAPAVSLAVGDWVLSQGTGANWTKIAVVSGATGTFNDYDILCDGTYFTPDMTAVADVRDALVLLWGRVQIATTAQLGVVKESSEVLVDNSTGEMTVGVVDDGSY
jgi:hypothetical protein